MSTKNLQVSVKKNDENPESEEIIAASIIAVAEGFERINHSRLKRRAILVLLKDATGVGFGDIEKLLDCSEKLKQLYIKPLVKK